MKIFTDASSMREWSRQQRKEGKIIGLVPTMGYLHKGHLSLVEAAKANADVVVASIYVNPTQFAAHEDFGVYPRSREDDRSQLAAARVAAIFEPASLYASASPGGDAADAGNVVGAGEHVPGSHETFIQVEQLQKGLCSKSRPHFFRGVATVVAKLFNIVEPDVAVFGQKDYQQWRILTRMARDLDFPVRIIGQPIAREADGLAMSSRNALLTPEDRQKAVCIRAALLWAEKEAITRGSAPAGEIAGGVAQRISEGGGLVDYVEVVDAEELTPVKEMGGRAALIAVAAKFGKVRLIDNIVLGHLPSS